MARQDPILRGLVCPYCKIETVIVTKRGSKFRQCPQCSASVKCHPGTETAMGAVASIEHRRLRYEAHRWFDAIWKNKLKKSRFNAYSWLSLKLRMNKDAVHFSQMDEKDCLRAIEICRNLIQEKAPDLFQRMNQQDNPRMESGRQKFPDSQSEKNSV